MVNTRGYSSKNRVLQNSTNNTRVIVLWSKNTGPSAVFTLPPQGCVSPVDVLEDEDEDEEVYGYDKTWGEMEPAEREAARLARPATLRIRLLISRTMPFSA